MRLTFDDGDDGRKWISTLDEDDLDECEWRQWYNSYSCIDLDSFIWLMSKSVDWLKRWIDMMIVEGSQVNYSVEEKRDIYYMELLTK